MPNFEFLACTVPEIRRGSQNSKIGSRDPLVTPFDLILHFWVVFPVANLSLKIDTSSFIEDRYIWPFLPLRRFSCKMPIRANFEEVFGGLTLLMWSDIVATPKKAHPWPETRVMTYRSPDRSRNVTWARGEERKKRKKERKKERKKRKEKERKETPRFDKSRVCSDHPRRATPIKVVMLGGVPEVVNHDKFHHNRFRGFGSLRGRNLPFSYAQRYGLYNSLGLPPKLC